MFFPESRVRVFLHGRPVDMRKSFTLETVVERPPGCVPRGVQQGTTRRNSRPIPTSCNAAGRRAGRAMGVVAALNREVSLESVRILESRKHLKLRRSGQLPFLGSRV
jgi:hypothetical protein